MANDPTTELLTALAIAAVIFAAIVGIWLLGGS